jgi:flagellar hook-basal body complex protein FliE
MIRVPSSTELQALLPTENAFRAPSADTPASAPTSGAREASFEGVLMRTVEEANAADRTASAKIEALASGASDDLHGTMISAKEAEISIKLVGSIRNKVLDAFHEIWRTSV